MAKMGAPAGNTYAVKRRLGRSSSIYITDEEWGILQQSLARQQEDVSDSEIVKYLRQQVKQTIQGLKPKTGRAGRAQETE